MTAYNQTNTSTITCPISLGGTNRTFHIDGSYGLGPSLNGSISDGGNSAGLMKSGIGLLSLEASNSYAGPTIITEGTIEIQNGWALGSTNAGTSVSNGATLRLTGNIAVGGEPLTLNGQGTFGIGCIYSDFDKYSWAGPVFLASDARIQILGSAGKLNLSGPIKRPGRSREGRRWDIAVFWHLGQCLWRRDDSHQRQT